MAGAIDSLSAHFRSSVDWTAQDNISGRQPVTDAEAQTHTDTYSTGTTAASAANQLYFSLLSIAGGGSTTIDLSSFTNVLNLAASFARIKAMRFRLLSASQYAFDGTTAGTACSSITLGNNGSNDFISQSNTGWLGSAAHTFVIANGWELTFSGPATTGILVDGTHKIIKITNNDGAVAASVEVAILGSES